LLRSTRCTASSSNCRSPPAPDPRVVRRRSLVTIVMSSRVAVAELAEALQDRSPDHSWWFDARTGQLEVRSDGLDHGDDDHPDERGLIREAVLPTTLGRRAHASAAQSPALSATVSAAAMRPLTSWIAGT